MNWKEYQKQALQFGTKPEQRERLLHAALGLCAETAELYHAYLSDPTAVTMILDELGDVCFYVALLVDVYELDFDHLIHQNNTPAPAHAIMFFADCMLAAGIIANQVKKQRFAGQTLTAKTIVMPLSTLHYRCELLALRYDTTLSDVLLAHLAKIEKRNKEGRYT